MRRVPLRWVASAAFAAAIVPLAIATHLVAEITALGYSHAGEIVCAARHGYLIAIGTMSIAALISLILALRARDRTPAALLTLLPFGGRGLRFAALTFGGQLAFFAATQILEESPIFGGDVVASLVSALLIAAFGSLVLAAVEPCVAAVTRFVAWISAMHEAPAQAYVAAAPVIRFDGRRGAYLFSTANRPPPVAAVL